MSDLISVIIPAYKGAKYIGETIEAINKQNMNTEIIVVDDCSPDNTAEIAQKLGCRIVRHEKNQGQVAGRNTGINVAEGKYIIFNDQDDVMRDGALRRLYDELNSDEKASAVMAKLQDYLSDDITKETSVRDEPYYGLLSGAVLFKSGIFKIIHPFKSDSHLDAGEMILLQHQMEINHMVMRKIDFISTNRRIHDNNFGRQGQKKEFQDYASLLRAKLAKK